jgi:hypothetical protein
MRHGGSHPQPDQVNFSHATRLGIYDLFVGLSVIERRPTSMLTSHSSALLAKHAGIEARIAAENRRPSPDDILIAQLKKQKLRIKEAIARL